MANDVNCPRCLRANRPAQNYCIGCGYRLSSPSRERPSSDDLETREIRAEMASVLNELVEATSLLRRIQNRVAELERRTRSAAARPQRSTEAAAEGGEEVLSPSPPPRESVSDSADSQAAGRGVSPESLAEPAQDQNADTKPSPRAEAASRSIEPTSFVRTAESAGRPSAISSSSLRDDSKWDRLWDGIDWERTIGRNWFAIVGSLAVALGIGFFLRLAFDNNWISDTGRVALGAAVGLGLLGIGEYAQRRVPRWARPVTASGASILYLSIYAAFGLYQLISPEIAFLLLAIVVAVASLLALRYQSLVVALLGVIGAFISPILLGRELPDPRWLIGYILIIDVGILAISTFRNWRWFTLIGWVGSYGLFLIYLSEYQFSYDVALTHIALTLIFLTFAAATPLFHILWRRAPGPADFSLMSLNATGYFGLTLLILWDEYSEWLGLVAFSLAAFYALIALLALRRGGTSARVIAFSLGIAVVFLTIAFPLQLDGYSVAIAWAAQGAMFVWMGLYLSRWQTRLVGLAILALALLHVALFDAWVDLDGFRLVLNGRFATVAIVIAAFYAAGLFYWRNREASRQFTVERYAAPILLGVANLITLGLFSLEIINYFDSAFQVAFEVSELQLFSVEIINYFDSLEARNQGDYLTAMHLSLTALWAIYGSVVASVGLARDYPAARWAGLALLSVATIKLLAFDAVELHLESADLHARAERSVPGLWDSPRARVRLGVLVRS